MIMFREGEVDQRTALANQLVEEAKTKPVYALDSDLASSSGLNIFAKEHPEKFINCGIQEANMFGVAAAMAKEGFIPFVHTFSSFASRRALDQLYVSAIYNESAIKIISTDPGILNSANGGTHVSFEDIGIISSLPNVVIIDFTDPIMINKLIPHIIDDPRIYYLRMQRKTKEQIYERNQDFEVGKGIVLSLGNDVALICNSQLALKEGIKAKNILEKKGYSISLIDMFTVKPLDEELVLKMARRCKIVAIIENSSVRNGLGAIIADTLLMNRQYTELLKFGIPETLGEVGSYDYLIEKYGFDANNVVRVIEERLNLL
ncbi:MAG TPA: transketolase family protein [Clostridiaceae bacterium]|nr:transketolase family protein [Clostridiaceae bacterium]